MLLTLPLSWSQIAEFEAKSYVINLLVSEEFNCWVSGSELRGTPSKSNGIFVVDGEGVSVATGMCGTDGATVAWMVSRMCEIVRVGRLAYRAIFSKACNLVCLNLTTSSDLYAPALHNCSCVHKDAKLFAKAFLGRTRIQPHLAAWELRGINSRLLLTYRAGLSNEGAT